MRNPASWTVEQKARIITQAAQGLLTRVAQTGAAGAAVWLGLAAACRQLDRSAEESHALYQALKLDANFVPCYFHCCDPGLESDLITES